MTAVRFVDGGQAAARLIKVAITHAGDEGEDLHMRLTIEIVRHGNGGLFRLRDASRRRAFGRRLVRDAECIGDGDYYQGGCVQSSGGIVGS